MPSRYDAGKVTCWGYYSSKTGLWRYVVRWPLEGGVSGLSGEEALATVRERVNVLTEARAHV
jgi:hypothetical protein